MTNPLQLSSCCQASMSVVNEDEGTCFYACDACKMPCDPSRVGIKEQINNLVFSFTYNDKKPDEVADEILSLISQAIPKKKPQFLNHGDYSTGTEWNHCVDQMKSNLGVKE